MDYPKHLYEKIREEVAVSYLKHELKKIFPSIKAKDVDNLMQSKELCNPRDFWNGVHGIGMGFKLHIGFIFLVTAENIRWTKEKINIEDLYFGVNREITDKNKTKSVKQIIEKFKTNKIPVEIYEWDRDPIFVVEKAQGLSVYDGNNRLEKYISNGIKTIDAYVGRYSSEVKKPVNYWLPTSTLIDILYYVYLAIDNNDENLFDSQIAVLKNMLSFSESGKYEFKERALTTKKEYRDKILAAVKII